MNTTSTIHPSARSAGCRGRRRVVRIAAAVAATALVAGCGDDAPGEASRALAASSDAAAGPATTDADPHGEGATTAGCDAYTEVTLAFNGEPDPAALTQLLDELEAEAPDAVAAELTTMIVAARSVLASGGEDFGPFETVAFQDAMSTVDPFMFEHCEYEHELEVVAHEYEFEGLPDSLAAGRTAILLSNHGSEAHEIAVMRKAEGTTETWDELLALPQDEAMAKVVAVGGGFAGRSGDQSLVIVDLEPGEYVALCFVPVGTSFVADGQVTEGDGPPHFTQGMRHEFTVG